MTPSPLQRLIHGSLATVRYEIARSLSVGRVAGFAILGGFPAVITLIISLAPGAPPTLLPISVTSLVICVLANLLWSTSSVSSELEGKTWSYVAARPGGRLSLMIGKYVVSVGWTLLVTTFAISASIAVQAAIQPNDEELKYWLVFEGLAILACFAYAAVFTLLGAIFHGRAMVAAIVYTGVFELVIGSLAANVKYLTIRAPLVHLGAYALLPEEMLETPEVAAFLGDRNTLASIASIVVLTIVTFTASLVVARYREYLTTKEV